MAASSLATNSTEQSLAPAQSNGCRQAASTMKFIGLHVSVDFYVALLFEAATLKAARSDLAASYAGSKEVSQGKTSSKPRSLHSVSMLHVQPPISGVIVVEMEELCEHVALVVRLVVAVVGVELEIVVTSAEIELIGVVPSLALGSVTIRRSTTVLGTGLRLRLVICC